MTWSLLDKFIIQGIQFIVGIILARLLAPSEFGLIGMITIFLAISQTFIDSGFSQALIRKNDCEERDFNTVFYFNIFVSIVFYIILFFSAKSIALFFNQNELVDILRVLGLSIIITAFGIVQVAELTKNIDIKTQTKISAVSGTISGILAIYLANSGYGVWSLVWRTLSNNFINTALLWLWNKWRPKILFSYHSFKEMFSFSSKLLASGLLDTFFENLYYLVIGKYFSPQELGYYTRAVNFGSLPSSNISSIVQRVSYPVLAKLQDDPLKLKNGYKKLIKNTMFITFSLMLMMAAVAHSLVLTLIGTKWLQSIPYLQLLCLSLMLYPLHSLNLNILKVKGRSDLFLNLEVAKKILVVPIVIVGIYVGINAMIIGMIVFSFIAYFLNSYYSAKMIDYSVTEQLRDIFPSFALALFVGVIVFLIGNSFESIPVIKLAIQSIIGILMLISISEFIKLESYLDIKEIIFKNFLKRS